MLTTSDFGRGVRILIDKQPYQIVDMAIQSPSARGAQTLVKIKARNLLTGKLISETFKSGDKFEEPDLRFSNVQYLYNEGDAAVFMDLETYEQFNLSLESLGEQAIYLDGELKLRAMYFNDQPVNVEMPPHVPLTVTSVEPGTRGNTATGTVTTKATLSNGGHCQVPLNIKEGDRVLIDTETGNYYQRA